MPGSSSACLFCCTPCLHQCPACHSPVCPDHESFHHTNATCQPWKVSHLAGVGRALVATRDIQPWELVLEDTALVTPPVNNPVCLGCLGPVDGTVRCEGCGWAVCNQQCAQEDQHKGECRIFREKNVIVDVKDFSEKHSMYNCLAVLRLLMLKATQGEDSWEWSQVKQLMSHWEDRKEVAGVAEGVNIMRQLFVNGLGLDWVQLEDVQHVFGVIETNSLGFMDKQARAVYPIVSILSHSCDANLESVTDPGTCIRLRAKRRIKKGEELCIRYTSFLDTGTNIREKLKSDWFFDCGCSRCRDPTEFGSYFSSPKCNCGGGYLLERDIVQANESICKGCGEMMDYSQQREKDKSVEEDIVNATLNQIHAMYKEVKKESQYHRHYHIRFKLGRRLLELGQKSEDREILEAMVEAGKDVMETLMLLDRGYSKLIGRCMLLFIASQQCLIDLKKMEGKLSENSNNDIIGDKALITAKFQALKMASSYVLSAK